MSVRLLTSRLFKHGRLLFQNYCTRGIHSNILEQAKNRPLGSAVHRTAERVALRNEGLFRFGQQARKLFVDNILSRVTTTYSAELRTQATKKFLFGDSTPFFALVGVSLASGTGFLTKDDELEGICWEIRDAVSRFQTKLNEENISKNLNEDFGLDDLNIGPPIAKGCAAVVYAADFKNKEKFSSYVKPTEAPMDVIESTVEDIEPPLLNVTPPPQAAAAASSEQISSQELRNSYILSPIRASTSFGSNPNYISRNRFGSISEHREPMDSLASGDARPGVTFHKEIKIYEPSNVISYPETVTETEEVIRDYGDVDMSINKYPLALKMMFNYDVQSNAMAILRAMYKETIPARRRYLNSDTDSWEKILLDQTSLLPPHPNIVLMFGVFCAQIPELQHSAALYPMALPPRINPRGYGRNMSLFLLMKRYNSSLRDYIVRNELDMRTKILLFAQLLEAVAHMYRYGVSHRDIKSDNILIELNGEKNAPVLVLSDFGCSLADKDRGFLVSYPTSEIDKGGNTALMAPEIITKEPGAFSILNYSKSDLWSCGAIGYEIFGNSNPFYGMEQINSSGTRIELTPPLQSYNYKDTELPELSSDVPLIVRMLIGNILQRNPKSRLSPDVAANVMQIYLWGPTSWLKEGARPSSAEIMQWLLTLTTKILCEGRLSYIGALDTLGRRTHTEYLLISGFLIRARLNRIRIALEWMQNVISVNQ